jgi:hypothetical protein
VVNIPSFTLLTPVSDRVMNIWALAVFGFLLMDIYVPYITSLVKLTSLSIPASWSLSFCGCRDPVTGA